LSGTALAAGDMLCSALLQAGRSKPVAPNRWLAPKPLTVRIRLTWRKHSL